MPTYEYLCKKCGKRFERWQSITEPPLKTCPKKNCSGKAVRHIGGGGGFLLKGSGFYTTDYRKSDYVKAAKKDAPEKKPAEKKKKKTAEKKA